MKGRAEILPSESGCISGLHPLSQTETEVNNSIAYFENPNSLNLCVSTEVEPFQFQMPQRPRIEQRSVKASSCISSIPRVLQTPVRGSVSTAQYKTPKTPGSTANSYSQYGRGDQDSTFQSCCIVAVLEGRGGARGEVGLAVIALDNPTLVLCQFSDSRTYTRTLTKLELFRPMEILIPLTGSFDPKAVSKLNQEIAECFPRAKITPLQRRYFSEVNGLQMVRNLCVPEYATVELQIKDKYYSLAAASALIKFVEHSQNTVYAPKSLKVEFQASSNTTMIDAETIKHVELLTPMINSKSNLTLFGILHRCSTPGGIRHLRANLFQPPALVDVINARLDAIEELIANPGMFHSLQSVVSRFCDMDQLLSLCVIVPKTETLATFEQRLNNVIGLKHALELVEPLHSVLEGAESKLLNDIYNSLEDLRFQYIMERVCEIIQDDAKVQRGSAAMKLQRCFAIRNGVNGLLDVARRTYCEIVDDIEGMVVQLAEEFEIPLRVGFNASKGYHVQLATGGKKVNPIQLKNLPKSFLRPQQTKNMISFTTEEIIQADQRSQESLREITFMSNTIIQELLGEVRDAIGSLYKLGEAVCSLDLLLALTEVSMKDDYSRPQFGNSTVIKQGRHPILDSMERKEVVANDTTATIESRFHVLTGANMSGKSTYLKQIILLQIMAQMGSFVPANFASFRIADTIMSRIGTGDSIESNASTFMLEMREMAYILTTVGSTSLIVMDELGRGTSTEEGTSLCWAISEELVKSTAFCFLATHFPLMTKLEAMYCTAVSHHFLTQDRKNNSGDTIGLIYSYKLAKGTSQVHNYGINLVKATRTFSDDVILRAEEIAQELSMSKRVLPEPGPDEVRRMNSVKLVLRLMLIAKNDSLDLDSKIAHAKSLQQQFEESESEGEDCESNHISNEF
ncbi:mutS protein homolog 4-like isoform X2 [Tigriopus californicus]|uniref:mutS protein homolog 4-like isoform X2 n=1 Tax=Tigriopus californicus TaxID=6832 RepID=UPI0027DA6FEF|nr:mutS protein homolog 4-like isoform X2 [Tigriopus californicus]